MYDGDEETCHHVGQSREDGDGDSGRAWGPSGRPPSPPRLGRSSLPRRTLNAESEFGANLLDLLLIDRDDLRRPRPRPDEVGWRDGAGARGPPGRQGGTALLDV